MPGTETRPVESDTDTGEGDGYAHYANKAEITRAAIEGGTVTALCGRRFPPIRDPAAVPGVPEMQGARRHALGPRRRRVTRPALRRLA